MIDNVNEPSHYTQGEVECIDAIKSALGSEGFEKYCIGCVMKYIWRYKHKNRPVEDLEKAMKYLEWAIDATEKNEIVRLSKRIEEIDNLLENLEGENE